MNTTRARESFVVVVARTRIIEKEREREREILSSRRERRAKPWCGLSKNNNKRNVSPCRITRRGVGDFPPEEEEEEEEEDKEDKEEDESPL